MQCKDIPTGPILEFLFALFVLGDHSATWEKDDVYGTSVRQVMPQGTPSRLIHAKMRKLVYKGLISGCTCGCMGNFYITDKGRWRLRGEGRDKVVTE